MLTRIANGLLALTSKKQMAVDGNSTIFITELLKSVIQKLRPLATEKGVALTFDASTDTNECAVLGDHTTLSRAFENLIENGIKYTKSSGSVMVSVQPSKSSLMVQVKDTGIGIAPKDLPHVTEPFFRADLARTSNEGSGLGLSIVLETIDAHEGNFSIHSEVGIGTTVTITLPLAQV